MEHFWVISQNRDEIRRQEEENGKNSKDNETTNKNLCESTIYDGTYWSNNIHHRVFIKIDQNPDEQNDQNPEKPDEPTDKTYYGSYDQEKWELIESNHVFYQSDIESTIIIIFSLLWLITIVRLTLHQTY